MRNLRDCLGKVVGKLVSKEDADQLVRDAYALEARGLTPIEAERQAVRDSLDAATRNGEEVLRQVQLQRPQAYQQARNFWEKETIRKAGMVPPPLPRFITGPTVPADAIIASHDANGGSTVNAVHGDLAYTNSFSVSIFPDLTTVVPGKAITPEQIHAFAAKLQAAGIDPRSPNVSIGTWYDAETNTTFLDVAFTTSNREAAVALGQQFNQKAIFDLNAMEEVPLGGTGLALEGLPSVQERLGIMSSLAYIPPDARTAQETAAGAPGAAAPAPEGVLGGAQGGVSETGSVQEESHPDQVTGPISDEAQAIVDGLPEEQRAAAQKAFARDDRDPLADVQRARGEPVSKRKSAAIAPEKNTKLVAELSKYDFGKSVAESLQALASDPEQPRWIRLIADLFTQLGLGENVSIRAVNTPEASWGALYVFNRETGKGEVLINMTAKGPDLARRALHELAHHGTLSKLTTSEVNLTAAELAAKRELEKIFDYVQRNKKALGPQATQFGAGRALEEFVSEIFANDALRKRLNTIKPDGKVSLLQRFTDAVMKLLLGDRAAIMRPGSMLENAIRQAINVAGSPRVETSPGLIATMHERNSRAAREVNAHPHFQEELANLVAPMGGALYNLSTDAYRYGWNKDQAAFDEMLAQYPHMRNELMQAYGRGARGARALVAPMADNMGISEADQIERELDHEAAFYSDTERTAIEKDVDTMAKGIGATKAEIKDVKGRIGNYIKYYRAKHPAKAGWANSAINPVGLEELKRGEVTKVNPSGITFKVKFAKTSYTFARDAAGKLISRFFRQSKADAAAGKPMVDNPEWAKRRQELGDKMFDDLQGIMARRNEGGEKGRIAQVILDQINWYRDMAAHLRVTFGSMSDYVTDVIAGLSPITDVPGNWASFIDYFGGVMKGHYDDLYRKFDAYIAEDPENRTASTWRKAGGELPLKLKNKAKFGINGPNVMMAGLDLWRAVKTGTAPKARNFGLNLIGQSFKATIDRWAGRYLQRMHAPTWRLPPMIEGEVKGEHMPGEHVDLVSGDFGMGQDVFEDVAARLQESGIPEFKNVTAADLQAILWFAEKEIWEMRKWTQIMGAGSSMNALAQATAAQRYESGTMPGKVSSKDKQLMGETIGLRDRINGEQHVLGAKMVPSVNVHNGEESQTFDGDWITHPEYDPENTIGHVAEAAARLGKDGAHISRVIVNPYEVNENRIPGLHIFFRGRVGEAEIKGVLAKLKEAGITDGISLSVDPRVRPEIIKSLDPETGANQFNGVRVQHIPEYQAAGGMTRSQMETAFTKAIELLGGDASIAESRVLYYDTLVLKKGTDYDSSGKLTKNVSDSRARAWSERARREGAEAATRRDNARKAIDDRERQDRELELRIKREEQERIAKYEEFRRRIQPPDRANDGGVDPPLVAAMQYEDEQEPVRDPHGGRASLVRAMVDRLTGASRDREGIEVPQSQQEVRDPAGAGRGTNPGRKGSAPLWRPLGETFRKRESELYQRIESAAELIRVENPEGRPQDIKNPARYENSQKLFDYLAGKETPDDFELKAEIAELRKEIPVIPGKNIPGDHLDSGIEADVFHDTDSGVVHKLYKITNGAIGKKGAYVPGRLSLGADKEIRIAMGARPTLSDLLGRMERSNSHGALTPHELSGITPDGRLVFTSPFVEGREVSQENMRGALARAGVHLLSEMGGTSGVAKLDDGRWVLYDDLHPGNVRTMPGGRVEIVDANNRELDPHEVNDLAQLEKLPPERPLGPSRTREPAVVEPVTVAPMAEEDVKDSTDLSVAPMAGRGRRARVSVENYQPAGWTAPFKRLSWEIVKFAQQKRQMEAATAYTVQTMVKDFERKVKQTYKGKPSPEENKSIMMALGNLDNRLTQTQAQEARKLRGAEREGFLHTAHMENVARFKQEQERALNSLPDEIREAVNVLRETLDRESKEALKDTGLDTEVRARLSANQGVFLHSNAFQHFEDDVWGKQIKSDDPKAVQIRRAAEDLFRNEIIGENALAYQNEQRAKGIEVSDEDALRFAAASGDLDQQIATRLDDYLKKKADEPSRLHMLMGKMPVTRTEAGKMLSLDRENIPKEIRALWGQYEDPVTNFAKTLSVLAGHNAQTRMQNAMLEDGLQKGYFWKQDVSSGPRPPGLVQMTTDTHGPMVGVHGPPALKEGLSLMNQRPVRSLLSELNSVPLMMKTVGSVGSAVRNFFGNPLFMVSNGNLPISAVYWPKAFWLSLQRAADSMVTSTAQGRKELTRMIELGVLDENVDSKILERIAKNARAGQKWENQAGFGASVAAVHRSFVKVAEKTMIPTAFRGVGTAFQKTYTMADNFWRLANYNVELLRQKWMNPDLSLEQQEENAAEITRRTLPTYSNIVEDFRESYGKVRDLAAPYLSFQAEAIRTYASSTHLAFKEISSGKPKEVLSGLWRLGGLTVAITAPMVLGLASKAMFGYDDDDEKAIRAGLPEYQRNNMLFFLPRGPKGEPRYLDLNFANPYSLLQTAYTAAWRGTGLGGALQQFAKPLYTLAPVPRLITDVATNKDSRGGQVYDPYASGGKIAASIFKRATRDAMPGTLDSAIRLGEAYTGKDIFGDRLEKTGEVRDLREEAMKVFPGTAVTTLDREKAMQAHVNEYKTAARNASGLFDKKMSADGPIDSGEVAATYKEADERSFRALQQMRQAYQGLLKLGMTPAEAIKQMTIGFGSEIRKGGLSKTVIKEIISGNYQQFMPSKQLLKETAFKHPERLPEFIEAQRQQPRSRTASP